MNDIVYVLLVLLVILLYVHQSKLRIKSKNLLKANHQIEYLTNLRTDFINVDNRMVYLKNEDLQYIFVNSAMEKFYGKPSTEFIGRSDYAISSTKFADLKTSHDHDVLIYNKEIVKEVCWNNRVYKAVKFPVKMLNGTTGVGAYIEDVTEQKRIQKEIYINLKRNKCFVSALNQAFISEDAIYRAMLMQALELTHSESGSLFVKNRNLSDIYAYEFNIDDEIITQSLLAVDELDFKLKSLTQCLVSHIPIGPDCFIVVALSKEHYDFELRDLDHVNILIRSMQSIVHTKKFDQFVEATGDSVIE